MSGTRISCERRMHWMSNVTTDVMKSKLIDLAENDVKLSKVFSLEGSTITKKNETIKQINLATLSKMANSLMSIIIKQKSLNFIQILKLMLIQLYF